MRHRIIHIGAGTRPQELRFIDKEHAEDWLRNYQANQSYKDDNYRIVPDEERLSILEKWHKDVPANWIKYKKEVSA